MSWLGALVFVAAVIGGAWTVVAWRAQIRPAVVERPRFDGGRAIGDLAPVLGDTRLPRPVSVSILHDPGMPMWHGVPAADSILEAWATALKAVGADVHVRSPAAAAAAREGDVLLLAFSPCLGVDARRALDSARARGQGLILAGIVGVRDGSCGRHTGYGIITRFTGAQRVEMLDRYRGVYVALPDGGPLAAGIPPGSRLQLFGTNYVALRLPDRDGYYADSAMMPAPAGGKPLVDAAITHAEIDGLRVAYWGFDIRNIATETWEQALGSLLVRNAVAWAAGVPLATVAPWPVGRDAVAVLAQDVEDEFANASHALDSLRAARAPATFFVVSELAKRHPGLTERLSLYGDVGSHADVHTVIGGLPFGVQQERLQRTQHDLTAMLGTGVPGFRPPEEEFDESTLKAWVGTGGSYIFSSNGARTAAPELFDVDGRLLVLFGRVTDDDFQSIVRMKQRSVADLTNEYVLGFRKVRELGGLYILSYHSQLLSRPEFVPVLSHVARAIRADSSAWLTTGAAVADWWLRRHQLELAPELAGDAVELRATNRGQQAISGAVVRLLLPPGRRAARVDGARLLPSPPAQAWLALPPVMAGATSSFSLALAPAGR